LSLAQRSRRLSLSVRDRARASTARADRLADAAIVPREE
jgi:hypothetical protein